MAHRDNNSRREIRQGVRVLALSWVMALTTVGGWLAGWALDRHLEWTRPALSIVGVVVGAAGGGWYCYRTIMKVMRE